MLSHGSLFTGIGGFDLAARWAGIENIFQVEKDEFCLKVLQKNFKDVKKYTDIRTFNGHEYRNAIDIVSAGFPCQKYSSSGLQKGNELLKNEMLRVLSEILPTWIIIENVRGFLNKKFAKEFEELCTFLESYEYEVQTYDIDASSVNLQTMERHIWIVATNAGKRTQRSIKEGFPKFEVEGESLPTDCSFEREREGRLLSSPKLCGNSERVPNRVDRLKSLGNAIIPQIAFQIFESIKEVYLIKN